MAEINLKPAEPAEPLISKDKALSFGTNVLTVIVGRGSEAQKFMIHENILTVRSRFFEAAMKEGWKEAEDRVVKLPDDDSEIFILYEHLIYTGLIPAMESTVDRYKMNSRGKYFCRNQLRCQKEYELLCELYVLADKLLDRPAKNKTLDAILDKIVEHANSTPSIFHFCLPHVYAINVIYNKTSLPCGGRQLLVEAYVEYGLGASVNVAGDAEEFDPQFLQDLASAALSLRNAPVPQNRNVVHGSERYHECYDNLKDGDWEYDW